MLGGRDGGRREEDGVNGHCTITVATSSARAIDSNWNACMTSWPPSIVTKQQICNSPSHQSICARIIRMNGADRQLGNPHSGVRRVSSRIVEWGKIISRFG
jgi:hypothetical protein